MITEITIGGILLAHSIRDIKYKRIPKKSLLITTGIVLVLVILRTLLEGLSHDVLFSVFSPTTDFSESLFEKAQSDMSLFAAEEFSFDRQAEYGWLMNQNYAGMNGLSQMWETLAKVLLGIIPGLGMLLVSLVTRGNVGRADAYLLCITGAALGIVMNLSMLFLGLLLVGVVSAFLLLFRKVNKNTKLPFIPFLFIGYLLTVVMQHI